jgi:prephenate dehydrogenase
MAQSRITIIGTGLIGTSIGLASQNAKAASTKSSAPTAIAAPPKRRRSSGRSTRKWARSRKPEGAGLVIIATPVMAARQILQDAGKYFAAGVVVTDVCSTKADIMRWAQEFLPESVNFIGGHPMAGREKSGPDAATPELFKGATWAMTPSPRADERAVGVVLGLIETLGATPLYIDPAEHDQYAAAVSHLPLVVRRALPHGPRQPGLGRCLPPSQGQASDLTRLASGDPPCPRHHDHEPRGRAPLDHPLQGELSTIKEAIQTGRAVYDLFRSTQFDRDTFMASPPERRVPEGVAPPSAQDAMGRLFVGGLMTS